MNDRVNVFRELTEEEIKKYGKLIGRIVTEVRSMGMVPVSLINAVNRVSLSSALLLKPTIFRSMIPGFLADLRSMEMALTAFRESQTIKGLSSPDGKTAINIEIKSRELRLMLYNRVHESVEPRKIATPTVDQLKIIDSMLPPKKPQVIVDKTVTFDGGDGPPVTAVKTPEEPPVEKPKFRSHPALGG